MKNLIIAALIISNVLLWILMNAALRNNGVLKAQVYNLDTRLNTFVMANGWKHNRDIWNIEINSIQKKPLTENNEYLY